MAEIRPFHGLRFSADAGDLNTLVAPPYDVMSPGERNGYAAKNEFNIVHLTLPEGKIDDRSKFVKYGRASALLSQWRKAGILRPDPEPCFYRYTQTFSIGSDNTSSERTSLICLLKLEPYESGKVLPHEQTFSNHKEDRLRLLEATRTHLESIFGLYEDPDGSILRAIRQAPTGTAVQADAEGMSQLLEPITDPITIAELEEAFSSRRIWIADGHHRYETALGFRNALGGKEGTVAEDFLVVALASIGDPGLILMPTHRVVPALKNLTIDFLVERLATQFDLERCHSSRLGRLLLEAESAGAKAIGIALEGGRGLWATAKDPESLAASLDNSESERLRTLESTVLHKIVLERLLNLPSTAHMEFTRDAAAAVATADRGGGAAFLVTPPTIEDMKEIALKGEKMPHKSTYYYPKIWSGFVAWSFEDFPD